jgi:plastocyanin
MLRETFLLPGLVAALLLLSACKQEPAATPTSEPSQEAPAAAAAGAPAAEETVDAEPPPPLGATGKIEGRVTVTGEVPEPQPVDTSLDPSCADAGLRDESILSRDGGLANVVVRLKGALPRVEVPSEPVVMDQTDCAFRPRVLGAMAEQTVQVRNSDGTLHNVHSYAGARTLFNRAQPSGARPMDTSFPAGQELVRLRCDVHPWMRGWVAVTPHPWFAISDEEGRFQIENAPVGTWDATAWHEVLGEQQGTVTVAEDSTAKLDFTFDMKDAKPEGR